MYAVSKVCWTMLFRYDYLALLLNITDDLHNFDFLNSNNIALPINH